MSRRSHWGWGYADRFPAGDALDAAVGGLVDHLGFGSREPELPVPAERIALPPPRVEVPAALRELASTDTEDRARHARGCSYLELVRAFRGHYPHPPDAVLRPRDAADVERVLEWCASAQVACTPYGGGTSVVGGVTPVGNPAIALDLEHLDRVLDIDRTSLAARIQAGANGPRLEEQLREHGLTLRFFPQSFELSTLGGWIATRAGGHFATGPTHIDDLVESITAITPAQGRWCSRRLPGSGAGVSPDRLLLGSEGILGVITEAWVRVLPRPQVRRSVPVRFPDFATGAEAVRAVLQDGLRPSNCRLLDAREAWTTFAGDGSHALLVLGFESSGRAVEAELERALALCRAAGGEAGEAKAASQWRDAFLQMPYVRDVAICAGILTETFETAMTWERMPAFVDTVLATVHEALQATYGAGQVAVRFTHAYPDGAAPYFTCIAPVERGAEAEQWQAVKRIASDAVAAAGGTITHHHAVGRDHRPWYDDQRPQPFAAALRAAKATLDPGWILNDGVLIDR